MFKNKNWGIKTKFWLELNGRPVIGEGRLAMFEAIERNGSMIKASREINVSYRKMRGAIRDMEKTIGVTLVKAYRGGEEGGGALLTPAAHSLINTYKMFNGAFKALTSSSPMKDDFG